MANSKKRVVVGISGGVDSSVAAYLLKEAGYDVYTVIMSVWDDSYAKGYKVKKPGCFGPDEKEDIEAAEKIAKKLNVPFSVIDLKKEYQECIVKYFIEEYKNGKTANPCVQCNKNIKFGFLLEKVKEIIAFDYFATGHYARIYYDNEIGKYQLLKAVDRTKDQSYFLYNLTQDILKKLIFPIGGYQKKEVKEIAKKFGLGLEEKKESSDFFSIGTDVLLDKIDSKKGEFVSTDGRILGQHKGIQYYTIGQRKGLAIALGKPVYVVSIDKDKNQVVVGDEEYLFKNRFTVKDLNWIYGYPPDNNVSIKAKIRYRTLEEAAVIESIEDEIVTVKFVKPQRAITPGQSAVFYDGDIVLGGGVIKDVLN